jgi:pyruvate/2-oxoglutarate dehydrogenase complex dihydrolipoamide dehydrogenase (E3) component
MNTVDAIVIGSGQGGTPLSKKLADAGYKTVLIEKEHVGGTCVNEGCTPTKTLIGHATIADRVRNSEKWHVFAPGMTVDYERIWKKKEEVVERFRSSSEAGIKATDGLQLVYGEAAFTGPNTVEVQLPAGGKERYYAEKIFINAGCRPAVPDIPGLPGVPYLTSTGLLQLKHIPGHLIILGGSYIALEMAQLYHRLGSRVTILEKSPALLFKEDIDVSDCIHSLLQQEGITIHTNVSVERIDRQINENIVVYLQKNHVSDIITGTHLLVAAGRIPNTDRLKTDNAGLSIDNKGFIRVDSYLKTNVPGVYALGDIKGGPAFTHVAYNDFVVISRNLLENKSLSIENRVTPYCVFTDPQLGRVGVTEREAREKGIPVKVYVLPMKRVARGIETGFTNGMMKAVVHSTTGKILGAAIVGEQGGETMTVLQMAMQAGLTWEDIRYMMFAHPLYAESLNNLFMQEGK